MLTRTSHIPTVADLAADPITHHYDDMIAPAGLTNHLGTVRVDHDLTSVTARAVPAGVAGARDDRGGLRRRPDLQVVRRTGHARMASRPGRASRRAAGPGTRDHDRGGARADGGRDRRAGAEHRRRATARSRSCSRSRRASSRATTAWNASESPDARNEASVDGVAPGVRRRRRDGVERAGRRRPGDRPPERCRAGIRGFLGRRRRHGSRRRRDRGAGCRRRRRGPLRLRQRRRQEPRRRVRGRSTPSPPTCEGAVEASEQYWNAQLEAAVTPGNSEFSGHLPRARDDVGAAPPPLLVGHPRHHLLPPRLRGQRARPQLRHAHAELLGHDDVHLGLQPELGDARAARPRRRCGASSVTGSRTTPTRCSARRRSPAVRSASGTRSTTTR